MVGARRALAGVATAFGARALVNAGNILTIVLVGKIENRYESQMKAVWPARLCSGRYKGCKAGMSPADFGARGANAAALRVSECSVAA